MLSRARFTHPSRKRYLPCRLAPSGNPPAERSHRTRDKAGVPEPDTEAETKTESEPETKREAEREAKGGAEAETESKIQPET